MCVMVFCWLFAVAEYKFRRYKGQSMMFDEYLSNELREDHARLKKIMHPSSKQMKDLAKAAKNFTRACSLIDETTTEAPAPASAEVSSSGGRSAAIVPTASGDEAT